jgi:mRNA interferase MazF
MIFEQGDIVEVNFDPSSGHEPQKKRPALVVSRNDFNDATSMTLVCPVTSKDNGFFLHLPIPLGHDVHGFAILEQLRAMDLETRKAIQIDHLSKQEMRPFLACLKSFFGE